MTPELIGIILGCILLVICAPMLWSFAVDYGAPLIVAMFRRFFYFEWHGLLSSVADDADQEPLLQEDKTPATTTQQNSNNGVAITQNDSNALLLAQAKTLAVMVKAGKIGETEGIRLVFGCAPSSSNPKYIAARAALKTELEKLEPPKFRMTPEQEKKRQELGLPVQ